MKGQMTMKTIIGGWMREEHIPQLKLLIEEETQWLRCPLPPKITHTEVVEVQVTSLKSTRTIQSYGWLFKLRLANKMTPTQIIKRISLDGIIMGPLISMESSESLLLLVTRCLTRIMSQWTTLINFSRTRTTRMRASWTIIVPLPIFKEGWTRNLK